MSSAGRQVIYSGRVQGVGFRASAHRLASGYEVSGSVRNRPDGTVELVASGEPGEVDAFLAAVAREFAGKIRHAAISDVGPDSGEPSGFSIRY